MGFPNGGEGGGVPHWGKIPTFSRYFFGELPLQGHLQGHLQIDGASSRSIERHFFSMEANINIWDDDLFFCDIFHPWKQK